MGNPSSRIRPWTSVFIGVNRRLKPRTALVLSVVALFALLVLGATAWFLLPNTEPAYAEFMSRPLSAHGDRFWFEYPSDWGADATLGTYLASLSSPKPSALASFTSHWLRRWAPRATEGSIDVDLYRGSDQHHGGSRLYVSRGGDRQSYCIVSEKYYKMRGAMYVFRFQHWVLHTTNVPSDADAANILDRVPAAAQFFSTIRWNAPP